MKTRSTLATLLILFAFSLSCKKSSSDPNPGGPCTEANLKAKSDAYSAAVNDYVAAQTTANCNKLVSAYDAYLSAAQNCTFVTQANRDAILKARNDLANACK